jgi:hypothetical protein
MSWYTGTLDDAHKAPDRVRIVAEKLALSINQNGTIVPVGVLTRVNVITTERWVGIEGTTAIAAATAMGTIVGLEEASAEPINDAGAYAVVKTVNAAGTWF